MATEKKITSRIQQKHDVAANWAKATNFIPKKGEIIIYDAEYNASGEETQAVRFKIGDGSKTVNNLPFAVIDYSSDIETLEQKVANNSTAIGALQENTVPKTRKINNKALSSDITLGAADVGVNETTFPGLKKTGTVTGVKMNGTTKNPSSGVVDLGTVITAHQSLDGKQDKITSSNKLSASLVSGLATVATSGSYNDLSNKPTINGVEITGTKTSTDLKLGKVTANGGFQAGSSASATTGGAAGQGASATSGGAAGQGASATSGGAVGNSASAIDGGAVGGGASATYGGAVGGSASATFGGAVGYFAKATTGGAVGQGAKVTTGFAGGFNAKAQYKADGTTEVRGAVAIGADAVAQANNAVQLSTGTNANEGSLQFRDYPLVDVNGKIPADRLPGAGTSLGGVKTGGDVTITDGVITVSDDSHNHVISNIDGLQTELSGKANLTGGNTFTGTQTLNDPSSGGYSINAAGYIKGSQLQAPSTGKASSNTGKVCVLDGSGWVYYRTPAEIVSDGGGATADQIPTVNNGKLTIQKNGTDVATFTANQSTNVTANITVPTKVSEITNDSGYTTNKGTVTSVAVKMNGSEKGKVTSSGTIDLGTVITSHQDISGKLDKTTYEWNKEFRAGSNGAISLGRYNVYDTQLTFDISSTTTISMNGKLVIATQNGRICQAKVFGDATGVLVSKIVIYQSAIVNNRSWVEVFCNFDGWSKNKVHIYGVALESATVTNQMSSVTFTNGVPSPITSGDFKWSGTIDNDLSRKANLNGGNNWAGDQQFNGGWYYFATTNDRYFTVEDEDGTAYVSMNTNGLNLDPEELGRVQLLIKNNAGTAGQVLTSQGADRTPTWTTPPQFTLSGTTLTITV